MHIEFVRSGGFAGLRLAASIDSQHLTPEQASTLDKLIAAAGFFDLPERLHHQSLHPTGIHIKLSYPLLNRHIQSM
jgi:hypothetical protein